MSEINEALDNSPGEQALPENIVVCSVPVEVNGRFGRLRQFGRYALDGAIILGGADVCISSDLGTFDHGWSRGMIAAVATVAGIGVAIGLSVGHRLEVLRRKES